MSAWLTNILKHENTEKLRFVLELYQGDNTKSSEHEGAQNWAQPHDQLLWTDVF